MPATDRLIQLKGIAEIFVALILTVNPQLIYDSPVTHKLSRLSGLVSLLLSITPHFSPSASSLPSLTANSPLIPHHPEQHTSNASTAPGFNQSIACMVAAVGVGHLVASRAGRGARSTISTCCLMPQFNWEFSPTCLPTFLSSYCPSSQPSPSSFPQHLNPHVDQPPTHLLYSRNEPHLVPPRLPHLCAARRQRFRKRNAPPVEHVTCSV